jgi:hypothetical protein
MEKTSPMKRFAFATLFLSLAVIISGCGESYHPVTGTVTLDGQPLAEATVSFNSDDGKTGGAGFTDASGNFTIESVSGKKGLIAGNYKVTVLKTKAVEGVSPASAAEGGGAPSKDYIAAASAAGKKGGKGSGPPTAGGKTGGSSNTPTGMSKNEIPAVYGGNSSPLTAKVPSDGPVKLELKSKP